MANVSVFVRNVRRADFRKFLTQLAVTFPADFQWTAKPKKFGPAFKAAYTELSATDRRTVERHMEKVSRMADEVGQAAMQSLAGWQERFDGIEQAHARALLMYVEDIDAFRRAEDVRYAEENRHARRLWDGFIGPKQKDVRADESAIAEMTARLPMLLGVGRIYVEPLERAGARTGEADIEVHQVTIFSEDAPVDEPVFASVGVEYRPRRPVRETVIVYTPETGAIEVIGKQKAVREAVAKIFAEVMLATEIKGERLPRQPVNLSRFLTSSVLPLTPSEGVARAKLTMLTLSTLDDQLTGRYEVPYQGEQTLAAALNAQFGSRDPLTSRHRPWMARIELEMQAEPKRKRGNKINVELCLPNKHNLRGKTYNERRVLNGCLRTWGLLLDPPT